MALQVTDVGQVAEAAAPIVGPAFTMAGLYRFSTPDGGTILGLGGGISTYVALAMLATGQGFLEMSGGGTGDAFGASNFSAGSWHSLVGVANSDSSRVFYANGVAGTVDTTSLSPNPASRDRITVGMLKASGNYISSANGDIAEVAVWNVALTADEAAMLSAHVCPLLVRPSALVFYSPLYGNAVAESEPDMVGGRTLIWDSRAGWKPVLAPHPAVLGPRHFSTIAVPDVTSDVTINAVAALTTYSAATSVPSVSVPSPVGLAGYLAPGPALSVSALPPAAPVSLASGSTSTAFPTVHAATDNFSVVESPLSLTRGWAQHRYFTGPGVTSMLQSNGSVALAQGVDPSAFYSQVRNAIVGPDTEVGVQVNTKPNNGSYIAGLFARLTNDGTGTVTGYALYVHADVGADAWQLYRLSGVNFDPLGSSVTQEVAAGDHIGFAVTGTGATVTLTGYRCPSGSDPAVSANWAQVVQSTDTSAFGPPLVTAGCTGIEIETNVARFTRWFDGTITPVGAVPDLRVTVSAIVALVTLSSPALGIRSDITAAVSTATFSAPQSIAQSSVPTTPASVSYAAPLPALTATLSPPAAPVSFSTPTSAIALNLTGVVATVTYTASSPTLTSGTVIAAAVGRVTFSGPRPTVSFGSIRRLVRIDGHVVDLARA